MKNMGRTCTDVTSVIPASGRRPVCNCILGMFMKKKRVLFATHAQKYFPERQALTGRLRMSMNKVGEMNVMSVL